MSLIKIDFKSGEMIIITFFFFFLKNNIQSVIKNIRMAYLSLSKAKPAHTHFNERGFILVTCYEFQQKGNCFVQPLSSNSYH